MTFKNQSAWLVAHYLLRMTLARLGRVAVSLALVVAMGAVACRAAQAQEPKPALQRFALVISSNQGNDARPDLRFANSDAQAMARVLTELGGLKDRDLIQIPDATRSQIRSAFGQMATRMRAQDESRDTPKQPSRRELFVYYSGHSDENGLLLGEEVVTYRELRAWIDAAQAEVRIAVLDSCASGALIRLKGGKHRPSFLADVSSDARGHAFLTASSADESAQESDRIGAAYFTHYLVSGLRGAADASHDGRVTLGEAYQFAYHETLRRTQKSIAGPQHAAYDIQLAGTGDLVITDLRATDARLVLDEALLGRVYVRDSSGRLVVEMRKEPHYPVELGLQPGRYEISVDRDGALYNATVAVAAGQATQVLQSDLTALPQVAARARGPQQADEPIDRAPYRDVTTDFMLFPGLGFAEPYEDKIRHRFVLGIVAESDAVQGAQVSLLGNIVRDKLRGAQVAVGFNWADGPVVGVQAASGVNIARAGFTGLQTASGVSIADNGFSGAQVSVVNLARGHIRGAQVGVVNAAHGQTHGAQVAVVNVQHGDVVGAQVGVTNLATGTSGTMVGVVNIGGTVQGPQIGVVNVADSVGSQFGVVNVARDVRGPAFGLLTLSGTGYHAVQVFTSDINLTNVSLKLGSRHVYSVLGAGLDEDSEGRTEYGVHLGFGGHIVPQAEGPWFVDVDLLAWSLGNKETFGQRSSVLGSLRAVAGYSLGHHVAITAGLTYNVETSWNGEDYDSGLGFADRVQTSGRATVRQYPGFVLGLQI